MDNVTYLIRFEDMDDIINFETYEDAASFAKDYYSHTKYKIVKRTEEEVGGNYESN